MPTRCFFLEPTDQSQFSLRRWNKYTGQTVCGSNIHVDKNGKTCGAGAGSIQGGNYHGFLHHGELTDG